MNNWKFNGKEISDSDIPPKSVGFIYIITQISTGRLYIGRKMLYKSVTRSVKGKKKKTKVPSDWKDYWSSSPWLLKFIEDNGTSDFTKEILLFCDGKGEMAYAEENLLHHVDALMSPNWINENIRSKLYRSWVKRPDFCTDLKAVKAKLK